MNIKEDIKSITYLKDKTDELVAGVSGSGRSIIITQNGEARVVVMDVAQYERWRNAMAMMKVISQSEADIDRGKVMQQDDVFDSLQKGIRDTDDA